MRGKNLTSSVFGMVVILVGLGSVLLMSGGVAYANTYELTPNPADLYDLAHARYYTWGINTPWNPTDEVAIGATFSFENIRNWRNEPNVLYIHFASPTPPHRLRWRNEPNVLYIHLLDNARRGVKIYRDNQGGGDNFAGQGVLLKVYRNLPAIPQDLSFSFTPAQIAALNTYASDGRFAMGFDPDCHFYNDGAKLTIETTQSQVPEPATMMFLISGLGLWMFRKQNGKHLA